jgi:hypothetical protein
MKVIKQHPLVPYIDKPHDLVEARVLLVKSESLERIGCHGEYHFQIRVPKRYKFWYTRSLRLIEYDAVQSCDDFYFATLYGNTLARRRDDFV